LTIMTAKQIIFVTIAAVYVSAINAQVYIELGPVQNNRDAFSSVTVYGSDGLRKSIPYDEIRGNAFWKNEWSKAYFYDRRDTLLGSFMARFNFVTNEVHYLDKSGDERAVIPGTLNKVVFMQDGDITKVATVFRNNIPEIEKKATCKTCFVEELNQGKVKLLKITKRAVKSVDSLFQTIKTYHFEDEAEYFLQYNEKYEKIKKLNKENLFSFLPNTSAYSQWVREQKLRFVKEEDFIYFINHYNTVRQNDLPE